jgi:hypothetical protein
MQHCLHRTFNILRITAHKSYKNISMVITEVSRLEQGEYSVLHKHQHYYHRIFVLGVTEYRVLPKQRLHSARTTVLL